VKTLKINLKQLRRLSRGLAGQGPSNAMKSFFKSEIHNEQNGGFAPSRLWSAMDSLQQFPDELVKEYYHVQRGTLMAELQLLMAAFGKAKKVRDFLESGFD
jgi:hypothetical protein